MKIEDPEFHAGKEGGRRESSCCFKTWEKPVLFRYIVEYFKSYPFSLVKDLSKELSKLLLNVKLVAR